MTNREDHTAMFVELPQNLILWSAGAFLLGWLLSSISSSLGSKFSSGKRDPRDDRIRSLEADLRVARSGNEKLGIDFESLEDQFKETSVGLERRDFVIAEQQAKLDTMSKDLKESVIKTRELRAELANRATENVHAEVKIREVETELSVAQASTDLIATGVLDYKFSEGDEGIEESAGGDEAGAMKAAT